MLDNAQLVIDYTLNIKAFFMNTLNALMIILLLNVQLLLHKTNTLRQVISAFVFILLLRALTEDFVQFYGINSFYGSYS